MSPRLLILAVCAAGIAGSAVLKLKGIDWALALPEWIPEFRPRPLLAVGERRLAAHWTHALALKPDHRLYGWGDGEHLGQPGNRQVEAPMVIDQGLIDWRYISSGLTASYAVTAEGGLLRRRTWGPASLREEPSVYAPVFADMRWTKVEGQLRTTMALSTDDRIYLWSEADFEQGQFCPGQIECLPLKPNGTLVHKADAELDAEDAQRLAEWDQGQGQSLDQILQHWRGQPGGENSPQAQQSIAAWQAERERQREAITQSQSSRRAAHVAARKLSVPWPLSPATDWADFCHAGDDEDRRYRSYALNREGKLWRIEFDGRDFSGHGDRKVQLVPLATPTPFQRVYCSYRGGPVFLLDGDRRLWGFGSNFDGQLSLELRAQQEAESRDRAVEPYEVRDDAIRKLSRRRWLMLAPGYSGSLGIASNGDLWAWGNYYGRDVMKEGHERLREPVLVDSENDWVEVAIGGGYFLARNAKGQLFTWGATGNERNPYIKGLLGDGGVAEHRERPRPVLDAPAK